MCAGLRSRFLSNVIIVLRQAVGAAAEEFKQTEVTKDLELLAYFGVDVGVFGVEFCEGGSVGVDIREGEFYFPK
jgi:hypothetical protein